MNILIFGGAGFVGRHYSEYFLRMDIPKNFNFNKIFMKNRHFLVKSINDFFPLNLKLSGKL